MVDFQAFKMCLETFESDAVDAYCQAPEHEEVVVEPAPEYLERLTKARRDTDTVWRLRRQLPGRRAAGQSWVVEHVAGILVNNPVFERCMTAPEFLLECSATRCIALHVDDIHGAATPSGVRLNSREVTDVNWGKPYEHLKRLRIPMTDESRIHTERNVSRICGKPIGTDGCEDTTDSSAAMDAAPPLTTDDTRRSCVGALICDVLDRADAQLEVSILGSYLRALVDRWTRC